jgi:capsular polysaccharide biosynthesis protein
MSARRADLPGTRHWGVRVAASTTRSFSDLPRILLQRWYFTLVGLLSTVLLCGLAVSAVPVKYQARAQILVLPPRTSVGTGGNPYLALGGLQAAADVLARAMSDGQTYQQLRSQGVTGTYTVARDLTTSGPILLVVADDSTAAGALATMNGILSQAAPRLSLLQDDLSVPQNTRLTSNVFTQDSAASTQRKSQIRAVLVAFAAGVFITIMLVSAADSVLARRRRRALARSASGRPDGDGTDPGGAPVTSRRHGIPGSATGPTGRTARAGAGSPAATGQLHEMMDGGDDPDGPPVAGWSAVTTKHAGRPGNG